MLDYDPNNRITMIEAKRHQFFQSLHNKAEDEAEEEARKARVAAEAAAAATSSNGDPKLLACGDKASNPIVIDESSCDSEKPDSQGSSTKGANGNV